MLEAEVDLICPRLFRKCGVHEIGEFVAELRAQSKAELKVDVADVGDTGEISDIHSGGVVVLRWKAGLVGTIPGGLRVLDNALR